MEKAQRPVQRLSDGSTFTASLAESEQLSGSDRSSFSNNINQGGNGNDLSSKVMTLETHDEHVNVSLHRNRPAAVAPLVSQKKKMSKSSGGSRSSKNSDQPQPPQGASSQEPL